MPPRARVFGRSVVYAIVLGEVTPASTGALNPGLGDRRAARPLELNISTRADCVLARSTTPEPGRHARETGLFPVRIRSWNQNLCVAEAERQLMQAALDGGILY